MNSSKYIIYKDIFIDVKKYSDCEYEAFAYGFDDLINKKFETEEASLNAIKNRIDEYIDLCDKNKIIYKKPIPEDCNYFYAAKDNADLYKINSEECVSVTNSIFLKESSFAISALLSGVWVYKNDGSFFVDFSKFLRKSKNVDSNKHVVFAPLTKKIYDIYYKLNYLFGIFEIYIDSSGLLIIEYDRRKIEYGHVYELEYDVYNESKGRGYLVIHRHGSFDHCEFKGFHNLIEDYQYRSDSALLEDYQVLSKLLPESDYKIKESAYKLAKIQLALLFRYSIESNMDCILINKFLKFADNKFFDLLNCYVFKFNEFDSFVNSELLFGEYRVYDIPSNHIEDAKIYKTNYQNEVLRDIASRGCQDDAEFEILKMHLAGVEYLSSKEKDSFNAVNLIIANVAWDYIGTKSDKNQILSVIAKDKINGKSDLEIYNAVRDMDNFKRIRSLLGIRSQKNVLENNDKFIKRIIKEYVFRLADEYHIPKPRLRSRKSTA